MLGENSEDSSPGSGVTSMAIVLSAMGFLSGMLCLVPSSLWSLQGGHKRVDFSWGCIPNPPLLGDKFEDSGIVLEIGILMLLASLGFHGQYKSYKP